MQKSNLKPKHHFDPVDYHLIATHIISLATPPQGLKGGRSDYLWC